MGRVIIAVSGWAKSGKDTFSNLIIKEKNAKKITFAEPLKNAVSNDFSLPADYMYDQNKKEIPLRDMPVEPKDKFSFIIAKYLYKEFRTWTGQIPDSYECRISNSGNEEFVGIVKNKLVKLFWTPRALMIAEGSIKRSVDSNFWVKKAIQKTEKNGLFIISDWRYRSELNGIKSCLNLSDKIITVRINRFENTKSEDSSERDLDDESFDFVIENKSSIESFEEKIKIFLKELGV